MPASSGSSSPRLWCQAGVARCGGGDADADVCLTCAHEYCCGGAPATLPAFVERLLAAGHSLADLDQGWLPAAAARVAVVAYVASCGCSMDPTGGREWDCSRMLTSLLQDADACALAGIPPHARNVIELGAGEGSLALGLTGGHPGFSRDLGLYLATDVAGRADAICRRINERAAAADAAASRGVRLIQAASLPWGEVLSDGAHPSGSAFDLILLCELLYYKGDADHLTPLAATLASACRHGGVALVAFRERSETHEAAFFALVRAKGMVAEVVEAGVVAAHAPQRRDGHGGSMVLMRVVRRPGEEQAGAVAASGSAAAVS